MSVSGRIYRALCEALPRPGDVVALDETERHHLMRVRRLAVGATVEVLDGIGGVGRATFDGTDLVLDAISQKPPLPAVEVAVAIPRGDRFDFLVEKCTELGVSAIHPLSTERGVSRPQGKGKRVERWRRIAVSALKQSGQPHLPRISPPVSVEECLQETAIENLLIADPGSDSVALSVVLGRLSAPVLLFIGPEGGFTIAEGDRIRAASATAVHLGPAVLRVETAAILGTGLLLAGLGALERGMR